MTSAAEAILSRLQGLHPTLIDLCLDRLTVLLGKLGHPERQLPPIVHVAGTNGKGSTCAFLRAIAEAAGQRVHVYTSPHLVRFNERIRIAGTLVTDEALEAVLDEVEVTNAGAPITVFEVITAAALVLFARTPADLCVLEVGLGGRGDATNVVTPAVCAITSVSLDHCDLLGDTLAAIAGEKAGILKPNVPAVIGRQRREALAVIQSVAAACGAPLLRFGMEWAIEDDGDLRRYRDSVGGFDLPAPSLKGAHQYENAGVATACMRLLAPNLAVETIICGVRTATWPARLQRLHGRLAAMLLPGWELWLDGGHNPGAGLVLAEQLKAWGDRPLDLVVGMKLSKDAAGFLRPLLPYARRVMAVAETGQHLAAPIETIMAVSGGRACPGPDVRGALRQLAAEDATPPARVLICGSLYLAGEVLRME